MSGRPFQLEQQHRVVAHAARPAKDGFDRRVQRLDDAEPDRMIAVRRNALQVIRQRTLGLSVKAFRADEGRYYHYEAVRDVEAAYKLGAVEGRKTLLAAINEYFCNGFDAGLEDGRAEIFRQFAR